jgi:signal recognition particle receptor subunit beta
MATINYAQKEISCKIVYYGPGLGGKTTNLQYIYKTLPNENRGELVSLATQQDRTLFFDFLPMDLGKIKGFNTKFHLYTVPGQVYYNATRKLVLRGVDGIVFVADSQRDRMDENLKSFQNLKDNLVEYNYSLETTPWVIQYNKRDLENIFSIQELETLLNESKVQYFESVATSGQGVKQTLKAISSQILERLKVVTEEAPVGVASLNVDSAKAEPEVRKPVESIPQVDLKPEKPEKPIISERKEVGKAPYIFTEEDPLSGLLPIEQRCLVYWKSVPIGSASLKLLDFQSSASRVRYRLKGELKILAFFRHMLDRRLIYRGKRSKVISGRQKYFFYLTDPPESRAPLADPFSIWIDEEHKNSFYLSYEARYGKIWVIPHDRKRIKLEE